MKSNHPDIEKSKLETEFDGKLVFHTALVGEVEVKSKWKRINEIGRGAHGKVWLQEEERGSRRAVKGLPQKTLKDHKIDVLRELQALVEVREHQKFFVEFLGWYEDKKYIYLAMEYIENGDLSHYLEEFRSKARTEAREITQQLVEGLVILHSKRICHRDLKPQNVLVASISPIWVKITDFGVSKRDRDTFLRSLAGTPGYMAPEVLQLVPRGSGPQNSYTNAADMWSLGCLVCEILTSETPFLRNNDQFSVESGILISVGPRFDMDALASFVSPSGAKFSEKIKESVAGEALEFLEKLLIPKPDLRMTAVDALKHSWLLESSEDIQIALKPHEGGLMDPGSNLVDSGNCQLNILAAASEELAQMPSALVDRLVDTHLEDLVQLVKSKKQNLIDFFPGNLDEALRPYSQKAEGLAVKLLDMGCPENIAHTLGLITLYDLVILIDDNSSMGEVFRLRQLEEFLGVVSEIYSLARDEGIRSVQYVNHKRGITHVKKSHVRGAVGQTSYIGVSRIGRALQERILVPFVLGKVNSNEFVMEKPLLVMIYTEGQISGEGKGVLQDVILSAFRAQSGRAKGNCIAFQFILIGNDSDRAQYDLLPNLDDYPEFAGCINFLQLDNVGLGEDDAERWANVLKIFLGAILGVS